MAALASCNFSIHYRSGKENGDADGLSRRHHDDYDSVVESNVIDALLLYSTTDASQTPLVHSLSHKASLPGATQIKPDIPENILQAYSLSPKDWVKPHLANPIIAKVLSHLNVGS